VQFKTEIVFEKPGNIPGFYFAVLVVILLLIVRQERRSDERTGTDRKS
jgi:hypothetical protein